MCFLFGIKHVISQELRYRILIIWSAALNSTSIATLKCFWLQLHILTNETHFFIISMRLFHDETEIVFEDQWSDFIWNEIAFGTLRCVHVLLRPMNESHLLAAVGRFALEAIQITRRLIFRVRGDHNGTLRLRSYFYRFGPCIETIQATDVMEAWIKEANWTEHNQLDPLIAVNPVQ